MLFEGPKHRHTKLTIYRGTGGGGNATTDTEVALLTQLEQSAVAAAAAADESEANAALSATNADASASAANADANLAKDWAIKLGSAVEGSEFSSKHHAQQSSASASAALNSADNAASSAAAAATFDPALYLTKSSPSYTGTLTGGTGVINIGSGQLYKDASGNVGIGTSLAGNAANKLTIRKDSVNNVVNALLINNGSIDNQAGTGVRINMSGVSEASSDIRYAYIEAATTTAGNDHHLAFATNTAGSTPTERLRITSAGRVGIGTSAPDTPLHVMGSIYAASGSVFVGNAGMIASDSVTRPLVFGTDSTERARIDSSGNLLVGTTNSNPVANSVDGVQFGDGRIRASKTDRAVLELQRRTTNGSIVDFRRDATTVGTISVTTTNTAYNTSSDYRLKHDIQPMTGALATVAQLKPVTYRWNADDSESQGFIAHELQEVVPQCVTGEKDAVDAEGNSVYQGIDTSFLVATLTAAIQEQQAIITALTARVEALEGTQP